MDEEAKKKEEELKKRRGILKRIGEAFGFAKTADDIKKNPTRIDEAEQSEEPQYDRATGLLIEKKKKKLEY